MIQFDEHIFSDGLKPPTSQLLTLGLFFGGGEVTGTGKFASSFLQLSRRCMNDRVCTTYVEYESETSLCLLAKM